MIGRGVALAYHGVEYVGDADDPTRLCVAPEHLEAHVRLLTRVGYRFVTAREVLEAGGLAPREAALTFDDGFLNWVTVAVPLLRRLGVRATLYVCPGWWGGRHPDVAGPAGRLLDEGQAHALCEAGMELGSHSLTHPDLCGLDDAALAHELEASGAAVEALTGTRCRTFAYPFGLHDERVEHAVAEAGYELAWAWVPGPWRPLAAPRLAGPPRHGARRLALKLLGVRCRRA